MSQKQHKSKVRWAIPYALIVLMLIALVLEGKDGLPRWANGIAGIAIVFIAFGSIVLWVHLNTAALMDEEIERAKHEKISIIEYLPAKPRTNELTHDERHLAGMPFNPQDLVKNNPITHSRN